MPGYVALVTIHLHFAEAHDLKAKRKELKSFTEQLRAVVANLELERRGLPNAQAVGALPTDQQSLLVRAILHRELGVMAIAAAVVAFLALRALSTSAGL